MSKKEIKPISMNQFPDFVQADWNSEIVKDQKRRFLEIDLAKFSALRSRSPYGFPMLFFSNRELFLLVLIVSASADKKDVRGHLENLHKAMGAIFPKESKRKISDYYLFAEIALEYQTAIIRESLANTPSTEKPSIYKACAAILKRQSPEKYDDEEALHREIERIRKNASRDKDFMIEELSTHNQSEEDDYFLALGRANEILQPYGIEVDPWNLRGVFSQEDRTDD